MGGKSEQGWISNGNPMETRRNLEKLSEGKVHILTRSATYDLAIRRAAEYFVSKIATPAASDFAMDNQWVAPNSPPRAAQNDARNTAIVHDFSRLPPSHSLLGIIGVDFYDPIYNVSLLLLVDLDYG